MEIGCPKLNYLLTYYDDKENAFPQLKEQLYKYIEKSYDLLSLSFKVAHSPQLNFSKIENLLQKMF